MPPVIIPRPGPPTTPPPCDPENPDDEDCDNPPTEPPTEPPVDVPEPGTLALFVFALGAVWFFFGRRRLFSGRA